MSNQIIIGRSNIYETLDVDNITYLHYMIIIYNLKFNIL